MKRKVAVFDIDGTLYRYVFHHAVLDVMERENLIPEQYVATIKQKRKEWKERVHPEAFWDFVRAQNDFFFEQLEAIDPKDYERIATAVVEQEKNHLYTYTAHLLQRMKEEGRVIIAISGSAQNVIQKFTDTLGFDICVAAQYPVADGKFTGEKILTYKDKDVTLKRLIEEHDLTLEDSYAIGDSSSDISLLALATHPIAFNPEKELYTAAKERGWDIIIERKNVILKLYKNGESYQVEEIDL